MWTTTNDRIHHIQPKRQWDFKCPDGGHTNGVRYVWVEEQFSCYFSTDCEYHHYADLDYFFFDIIDGRLWSRNGETFYYEHVQMAYQQWLIENILLGE